MTRRFEFVLVIGMLVASDCAQAGADDAPLFTAFKTFCVDTGAKRDAMKAAVEARGGAIQVTGFMGSPFHATAVIWNINFSGHRMVVSSLTSHTGRELEGSSDANDCILHSYPGDRAGVAAIRRWVGVAPSNISTDEPTKYYYYYQETGSGRSPLPAVGSYRKLIKSEGRVWSLMVLHSPGLSSVQFTHYLQRPVQGRK